MRSWLPSPRRRLPTGPRRFDRTAVLECPSMKGRALGVLLIGCVASCSSTKSSDAPSASSDHAPNPKLVSIAAGSALDLGKFSCSSPAGEDPSSCRAMTDYSGFAYDPRNHQMLAFGGGHATTMTDSIAALSLGGDLAWKALYASTPCMLMGPRSEERRVGQGRGSRWAVD